MDGLILLIIFIGIPWLIVSLTSNKSKSSESSSESEYTSDYDERDWDYSHGCRHDWQFSHPNKIGSYEKKWYTCRRCGRRGQICYETSTGVTTKNVSK